MSKPRLLDLFSGAGGAACGYRRAGFQVRGVDIKRQPRYCGEEFVQADALEYLAGLIDSGEIEEFQVIHASPPCQDSTLLKNTGQVKPSPQLIPETREALQRSLLPYVIKNVPGSPLNQSIMLCGASFGLRTAEYDLPRHRYFESNILLLANACSHRRGRTIGVYGGGTNKWHREKIGRNITAIEKREAMGIDWMDHDTLSQAIPPAYTEFIGRQLVAAIQAKEKHHAL